MKSTPHNKELKVGLSFEFEYKQVVVYSLVHRLFARAPAELGIVDGHEVIVADSTTPKPIIVTIKFTYNMEWTSCSQSLAIHQQLNVTISEQWKSNDFTIPVHVYVVFNDIIIPLAPES